MGKEEMNIDKELKTIDNNIEIVTNQLKRLKEEIEKILGYEITEKLWDLFQGTIIKSNQLRELMKKRQGRKEVVDVFSRIVKKYNIEMKLDEENI